MRARPRQRPCPHGREQEPSTDTREVRGLRPRTFRAKRRTRTRAKAKLSLGAAAPQRRPSGGRRSTLHLSEANLEEAARPPVVLRTVGRRSLVPSPPCTLCSRFSSGRYP